MLISLGGGVLEHRERETVDSLGNQSVARRGGRKSDQESSWDRFHNSVLQILSDPKIITDVAKNGGVTDPHSPDHRLQSGTIWVPPGS